MLKIAVAGADGRMGKQIVSALANDPDLELTATIVREKNIHTLTALCADFEVLIDFSTNIAMLDHLDFCVSNAKAMVIGVTGLSSLHRQALELASKSIPILYAANMSIGVNLCYNLATNCAKVLDKTWDVAVHDLHHKHKKDCPSGTSLQLAKAVLQGSSLRTENEIQFSSVRAGDAIGEHTVQFVGLGERIEIKHYASDRGIYARGALIAAKWLIGKNPRLYSMQDVQIPTNI